MQASRGMNKHKIGLPDALWTPPSRRERSCPARAGLRAALHKGQPARHRKARVWRGVARREGSSQVVCIGQLKVRRLGTCLPHPLASPESSDPVAPLTALQGSYQATGCAGVGPSYPSSIPRWRRTK